MMINSSKIELTSLVLLIAFCGSISCNKKKPPIELPSGNTSEIVRLLGYKAEEHQVYVKGGYILNLVRVTNPLVNEGLEGSANRSVVLLIHGSLATANNFLLFSEGASPEDHSQLDTCQVGTKKLLKVLAGNKASNSMLLTLLNFGHEVWLLNRRGSMFSQGNVHRRKRAHLGPNVEGASSTGQMRAFQEALENVPKSKLAGERFGPLLLSLKRPILNVNRSRLIPNPKYWAFTGDDVAKYDIPAVVDYILESTGRKRLALVAHSFGAGLVLNSLSMNRNLNDKFTKILLWSPALNLQAGRQNNVFLTLLYYIEVPAKVYKGDLPPEVLQPLVQNIGSIFCAKDEIKGHICPSAIESYNGPGADQLHLVPGDWTDQLSVSPSSELAQLAQEARTLRSTMYDYGPANQDKYGSKLPAPYEFSSITTDRLQIVTSECDTLVSPAAVSRTVAGLKVPYEFVFFNEENYYPGLKFNHMAYFLHKNITQLLVEPSLRAIQAAGAE